jgi:hypothetical protein
MRLDVNAPNHVRSSRMPVDKDIPLRLGLRDRTNGKCVELAHSNFTINRVCLRSPLYSVRALLISKCLSEK